MRAYVITTTVLSFTVATFACLLIGMELESPSMTPGMAFATLSMFVVVPFSIGAWSAVTLLRNGGHQI